MRKVVVASADATREAIERGGHRVDGIMVTLTYRPGAEYSPSDIRAFLTAVRNWARRRRVRLRYQWVLELQKRGAPHYHVLVWVPRGFRLPKPDNRGWWPHGMSRIERARRAVGYLVKYASKGDVCGADGESVGIPPHARLFGTGGLDRGERLVTHRAGLPRWLAEATSGRCRRIERGWLDLDTGEVLRSPWRVAWGKDAEGRSFVRLYRVLDAAGGSEAAPAVVSGAEAGTAA